MKSGRKANPIDFIYCDETNCWNVISHKPNKKGYIPIRVYGHGVKQMHRFVFESFYGPIENNLHVLHKCDNRKCINPEHLFLGSNYDNVQDRNTKNRQAKGEKNGRSKLNTAQVKIIRNTYRDTKRLAAQFGVCERTIQDARVGKNWKHI